MEEQYIRVGTTIYKVVQQPLADGTMTTRRLQWSFGTIRQDYGKHNIPTIDKYNGFCTVPSHTNYQKDIAGFYNLYEPIDHIPAEGIFPDIEKLMHHIFEEQYELGLDYMQLLYMQPTQKLPILLLVSEERNTGKTTFLNFLKSIFQDNATFNTIEDFRSQFNADWAGKLLIVVDEVLLSRREDSERLKNLSTAQTYKVEAKGKDRQEVNFFAKFALSTNKEGRMWFHPAHIKTEALDRIIQCNRNHTELDMVELIRDIMETQHVDKLSFIPQDLIPLLTMNGVKVEQWQIRKVVKDVWRLTPAHNALTYLAYQCDYTKPGRVSSISRVGRFYTVTKEFIDSLGL